MAHLSNYIYSEKYIHNKMLEETDSIEDEITLQKRLCPCTNQELEWLKNNTRALKCKTLGVVCVPKSRIIRQGRVMRMLDKINY